MPDERVDFLVVGGGPGGYAGALHAAHLGRRVTLVDRRGAAGLGGVCLHEGCIPTKALLHIAQHAAAHERFAAAGLRGNEVGVDLGAFQEWKQRLIGRLAGGVKSLLDAAGVTLVAGTAWFTGPGEVTVRHPDGTTAILPFTDALVAAGSRPVAPPSLPIDGEIVLDSTAALELTELPRSLVVVGGGSVGMELGAAFAKLGSHVTMVEKSDELLPMIDPVLVRPLRRRLRQLGVDVHTRATVVDHADGVALVRSAAGESRIEGEKILAGVGRRPATDSLGFAAAGVHVDADGFVDPARDRRLTPHIAAVGDITPGPFHAHKATAEARVAAEALSGRPAAFDLTTLPFIAHADPEIASVGLTPRRAAEEGIEIRTASFPLGGSGWAVAMDAAFGSAQLVVEAGSDVVLGVHLVGPHATELIGEGALAVRLRATVADLAGAIHAHPTLSEQLPEAADVAADFPLHVARRRASGAR